MEQNFFKDLEYNNLDMEKFIKNFSEREKNIFEEYPDFPNTSLQEKILKKHKVNEKDLISLMQAKPTESQSQ